MKIVRHIRPIRLSDISDVGQLFDPENLIVVVMASTTPEPVSRKEPLHEEGHDVDYVTTLCDRCGKMVERKSLTTIVEIAHGGTSTVNYPHDGKFRICKDCERWLLTELAYGLHNQWAQNKKEAQK